MESKYGLGCANVFHAGAGNLHRLILYDGSVDGELERAEALAGESFRASSLQDEVTRLTTDLR